VRHLVLLLFLATPVFADTVITTDGRRFEGTVTQRDGKVVVTLKKGVEIILEKADIEKIEVGTSLHDEYEKKKKELVPGDADVRYALAQWCKEKGLASEQKEMLEAVIRLSPDHAQARRDLGYVKDGDQWITEDALRKKLGFEKVNGKWVPAGEAKRAKRTDEIRKFLVRFALQYPKKDKKAEAARAELDALAKEDPTLVGPLVEERLGEHDATVRVALVQLLGQLKAKLQGDKLVTMAFEDDDADVRLAAAWSAWQLDDTALRTRIVQALFHTKSAVRDRAAEALGYIEDLDTAPYLIEALYLVGTKQVEVQQNDMPVTRGLGGIRAEGYFGGYWVQAGEVQIETRQVFIYSKKALSALKNITKKDFDFSKHDWFEWWEKDGKKKAEAIKAEKAKAAKKDDKPEGK